MRLLGCQTWVYHPVYTAPSVASVCDSSQTDDRKNFELRQIVHIFLFCKRKCLTGWDKKDTIERGGKNAKEMECRNDQLGQLKLLSLPILPRAFQLTCFPSTTSPTSRTLSSHLLIHSVLTNKCSYLCSCAGITWLCKTACYFTIRAQPLDRNQLSRCRQQLSAASCL